jgi:hypothetical protein
MDAQQETRALIRPVKESIEDDLLAREGVVGVDIAEKVSDGKPTGQLSIVVFVQKKKPGARIARGQLIPKEIDGVPTDVQELEIELQSAMVKLDDVVGLVDATAYPSLHGGISMGPRRSVYLTPPEVPAAGNYVFVGTLGAMVRDRATGATMALTNFHVACPRGWAVGDRMAQPSLVDNAPAATDFGSLTRSVLSENVDGAVVTLDAGKAWSASIETIGNVAGTTAATIGMPVQKRGRTTEHTFGTVRSTDFTVTINYGGDVGSRTLRNQVRIETDTTRSARFSQKGDSGSVIVGDDRNVIGLLFAGSTDGQWTFGNPIAAVQDELGVDIIRYEAPPIITRPSVCDPIRTAVIVCNKVTRPALCEPIQTRVVICNKITQPAVCEPIQTRVVICNKITQPAVCRPTRIPICDLQLTSAACDFPIPPQENPFGDEAAYGEEFLAGYLAALEAVATEEAADSDGQR